MAPICLPMNAFLRGERPLCFDIFPLDRNQERGKQSTTVSFYCFYLSSHLRRLVYLSSLKSHNKKPLLIIITHYFQTKTGCQKNSEQKEISRNVPRSHVDFLCYLVDSVRRKARWERSRKKISAYVLLDH